MAAWIKMRHDLADAPEVRRIARAAGLDRDQVVGKLYRFWTWADRHGKNGEIDADLEDIDDQVGQAGFAATLVSVGWLGTSDAGIVIPHWHRHFSDSAKVRALGQNRAERHRNATSVTPSRSRVTQGALPEKIREENPPLPPRVAARASCTPEAVAEASATLRAAWSAAAKAGHAQPYRAKAMPDGLQDRLQDPDWLAEALRAIDHLPRCKFFKTPVTLIQLCGKGFVDRVLAGQYDEREPSTSRTAPRGLDDRPPPHPFTGDDAARFEATKRALAEKILHEGAA
jgi:hypothetical protein